MKKHVLYITAVNDISMWYTIIGHFSMFTIQLSQLCIIKVMKSIIKIEAILAT